MPSVYGALKTDRLILQGHPGENVTLNVEENEFTMSMGNEVLLTVAGDGIESNASDATATTLTIAKNTTFEGDVTAQDVKVQDVSMKDLSLKVPEEIAEKLYKYSYNSAKIEIEDTRGPTSSRIGGDQHSLPFSRSTNKAHHILPFKYEDNLYTVTPGHSLKTAGEIRNKAFETTFKNIVPVCNYNISDAEMHLRLPGRQLYNTADEKYDTLESVGFGLGSDIWGYSNTSIDPNPDASGAVIKQTTHYSINTTTKGAYIASSPEFSNDIGVSKYNIIQWIPFDIENSWADVKTYNVTNLKLTLPTMTEHNGMPMMTESEWLNLFKENRTMKLELSKLFGVTLLKNELVPVTCLDDSVIENGILSVRVKTTHDIKFGFHFHHAYVETGTMEKSMYMTHANVHADTTRDLYGYITKEGNASIYALDLSPTLSGMAAEIKYDIKAAHPADKEFILNADRTVQQEGHKAGGHNISVCEKTRKLYVLGGLPAVCKIDASGVAFPYDGTFVYDISNLSAPTAVAVMQNEGGVNYTHDSVTITYNRDEQKEALGIPDDSLTDVLVLYVDCKGETYDLVDITNFSDQKRLHSYTIPEGGYYHQVWSTTDKKYVCISDEDISQENQFMGSVPVLRMYWSSSESKLQFTHVQSLKTNLPARTHNLYLASNVDRFNVKSKPTDFEDWLYVSMYAAGLQVLSLKYDNEYEEDMFANTEAYETRQDPFVYKKVGFCKTIGLDTQFQYRGSWSNYPFFQPAVPASKIPVISSDTDGGSFFCMYREGLENLSYNSYSDSQGIKKLHPSGKPSLINNVVVKQRGDDGYTDKDTVLQESGGYGSVNVEFNVRLKAGGTSLVMMNPTGVIAPFDTYLMANLRIKDGVTLDDMDIPVLAETAPEQGEIVYALCGNTVVAARVAKTNSTEYVPYETGTTCNDLEQQKLANTRLGEIVLTGAPALPGDSGKPVLNKKGELVGFINDSDGVGVGVVNMQQLKSFLKATTPPSATSTLTGVAGVANNRIQGITEDKSADLMVVAVNNAGGENNGKLYFTLSGSGTRYFYVKARNTGYQPQENGTVPEIYADYYATSIIQMSNNEGVYADYFTRSFTGAETTPPMVLKFEMTDEDFAKLVLTEEWSGPYQSGGPRVVFLEDLTTANRVAEDSATTRYANVYAVGLSDTDRTKVFSGRRDGFGGSFTRHLPQDGDVMTSEINGVTISVISATNGNLASVTPTWFDSSVDALMYPFVASVPIFAPVYARTAGALETMESYNFNQPLLITGLGLVAASLVSCRCAGLPISRICNSRGREYLMIDPNYVPAADFGGTISYSSYGPVVVSSIGGVPVDRETAESAMRKVEYQKGTTVNVGLTYVNTDGSLDPEEFYDLPTIPAREGVSWL